jgi:hypothetical protein
MEDMEVLRLPKDRLIMQWLGYIQWPAMLVTVLASWYVASHREDRRNAGFWWFLLSNALWVVWGWYAKAYALVLLQICLALMNIRGAKKTRE